MKLFGQTLDTLEQAINYSTKRNAVISNNIANVDTPNFKSSDVLFKSHLNNALGELEAKRTHSKHLSFSPTNDSYKTITNKNTLYNHNNNNVDIEKEMADLAKNQIYYRGLVDRMNGKFTNLQKVIKGGR